MVMGFGDALCYPNDMLGTEYCSYLWGAEPEVIRRMVSQAAERIHRVIEEACDHLTSFYPFKLGEDLMNLLEGVLFG